jgi:hypothetical protein
MISALIAALVAAAASHFSGFGTMQMTIGAAVVVFFLMNRTTEEPAEVEKPQPATPKSTPGTPIVRSPDPRTPSPSPSPVKRTAYALDTTPGSPANVKHIGEDTCKNLEKVGISTEAQLFGLLLKELGGSKNKEEADEKFEEFIEFLKSQGVPGKNARRAADDMRKKCADGLVLEEVRQNKALTSSEMWTTTQIDADRQQRLVDGSCNMHHGSAGPTSEKLMGLGDATSKKLSWNTGYDAYAQFLGQLDGKVSVKDAIIATSKEIGGKYNDTIGHQVMLEFQHGTYTQSSKLFHA